MITKFKCAHCGKGFKDYASNRKKSKDGKHFCSRLCARRGRAYEVSVALGGEKLTDPKKFKHGKSNRQARFYAKNVDRLRARATSYYQRNRVKILAQKQAADRALKAEIIAAYGGKCECCGEAHREFLTIDHVNGDGAAHRRAIGGKGRRLYLAIKAEGFPKDRYRLLCLNCNISLGFHGYCPHHPERRSTVSHVPFNPGRKRTVKP